MKEIQETPALALPLAKPMVGGTIAAIGYLMSKRGTKREDEFSQKPRNMGRRRARNRQKGADAEARANAQRGGKRLKPEDLWPNYPKMEGVDVNYKQWKLIKDLKSKEEKELNKLYKKVTGTTKLENTISPQSPQTANDIIKQGVNKFINSGTVQGVADMKLKNIIKNRKTIMPQIGKTGASVGLDTIQNLVNLGRSRIGEEISRRKKPSAVAKKKKLSYALKKLDDKKKAIKEAKKFSQLSTQRKPGEKKKPKKKREGFIFDKTQPPSKKVTKESRVMNTSSIEKSGPTIDVKATEVKDKKKEEKKKNGAIVKSKGSSLANRGTRNTEVKPERTPKPYRDSKPQKKDKENKKNGIAGKIGKAAKAAVGAVVQGYGKSSWNEWKMSTEQRGGLSAKGDFEMAPSGYPKKLMYIRTKGVIKQGKQDMMDYTNLKLP